MMPASEARGQAVPRVRSATGSSRGVSGERAQKGGWIFAAIVCGLIVIMPVFSAFRGVSQPLGRGLMGATDLAMVALFVWVVFRPGLKRLKYLIIAMIGMSILNILLWTSDVPLAATYQGFRKSILWLLAICIGYNIRRRDRNTVFWTIVFTCTAICLYAVKQWVFGFTAFDTKLLDAQAALEYTNKIGNYQRAISVLSSGFHVGMTGSLLILMALCVKFNGNLSNGIRSAALIVVGGLGIFASFTRTFMIIAGALSIFQVSRSGRHPLIRVALIVCAGIVVAYGIFAGYLTLIEGAIFSDYRFTSRSASYEQMASMFASNPMGVFSGFGLGSAGSTLGEPFAIGKAAWVEPHNTLLKYVVEFGLPLSLLLFWEIAQAVRASRPDPMLVFDNSLSLLCILLLVGAGLTITSVETWPTSLYIGLIIGMLAVPPARMWGRHP